MKRRIILLLVCAMLLSISAVPSRIALPPKSDCSSTPTATSILNRLDQTSFVQWIRSLSGESYVTINNQAGQLITTRNVRAMAAGQSNARAIPWLLEKIHGWLLPAQVEEDPFSFSDSGYTYNSENIIATFPGTIHPEEVVILSAHLDSDTKTTPMLTAPGAEDNGSGSAALLEAARVLRYYRFDRTLRLVWFNAEEEGMLGSKAYVQDHPTSNIVGVVNLDMFGYDSNSDGCFELHVGTLPRSDAIGQCFSQTIQSNGLPLTFEYFYNTMYYEQGSDHSSFWAQGVGAVEVLENFFSPYPDMTGGCLNKDRNPNYHTDNDLAAYLNLPIAFNIARAGITTAVNLAGPLGTCYDAQPVIRAAGLPGALVISWDAMPQAAAYQLERSTTGCSGTFSALGSTPSPIWLDGNITPGATYAYRLQVQAAAERGYCITEPICMEVTAPERFNFLPLLNR